MIFHVNIPLPSHRNPTRVCFIWSRAKIIIMNSATYDDVESGVIVISVTCRWIDYFSIFGPITAMKICPIANRGGSIFSQALQKHSKFTESLNLFFLKWWNIAKSGPTDRHHKMHNWHSPTKGEETFCKLFFATFRSILNSRHTWPFPGKERTIKLKWVMWRTCTHVLHILIKPSKYILQFYRCFTTDISSC